MQLDPLSVPYRAVEGGLQLVVGIAIFGIAGAGSIGGVEGVAVFGVLVLLMGLFTLCGRLRPFPQQLLFYPLLIRLRDRFIVLAVSVLVTAIVLLIFLSRGVLIRVCVVFHESCSVLNRVRRRPECSPLTL